MIYWSEFLVFVLPGLLTVLENGHLVTEHPEVAVPVDFAFLQIRGKRSSTAAWSLPVPQLHLTLGSSGSSSSSFRRRLAHGANTNDSCRFADGTGLRVDNRDPATICLWQAGRELCGIGANGRIQRRSSTAGAYQHIGEFPAAVLARGSGAGHGAEPRIGMASDRQNKTARSRSAGRTTSKQSFDSADIVRERISRHLSALKVLGQAISSPCYF